MSLGRGCGSRHYQTQREKEVKKKSDKDYKVTKENKKRQMIVNVIDKDMSYDD